MVERKLLFCPKHHTIDGKENNNKIHKLKSVPGVEAQLSRLLGHPEDKRECFYFLL
jgi:hypothetical protein